MFIFRPKSPYSQHSPCRGQNFTSPFDVGQLILDVSTFLSSEATLQVKYYIHPLNKDNKNPLETFSGSPLSTLNLKIELFSPLPNGLKTFFLFFMLNSC